MAGRIRSLAATVIGYVLAGLLIIWLLNAVVGTLFWLIRTLVFALVAGLLLAAYLTLRSPQD